MNVRGFQISEIHISESFLSKSVDTMFVSENNQELLFRFADYLIGRRSENMTNLILFEGFCQKLGPIMYFSIKGVIFRIGTQWRSYDAHTSFKE